MEESHTHTHTHTHTYIYIYTNPYHTKELMLWNCGVGEDS